MITFLLIACCLIGLIVFAVATTLTIGSGFIVVFGDVIVAILIIYGIITIAKRLFGKGKKD